MTQSDQSEHFSHISVLLKESIEGLHIKPDGIYVDCTLGGGGHACRIAQALTNGGRLIAIDRDADAIRAARQTLADYEDRVTYAHCNYARVDEVLKENGIAGIDGAIMDLGVSSFQLDTPERGFSYRYDAPLDMRMDQRADLTAKDVVNTYSYEELRRVLHDWGEERFAASIAAHIVSERQKHPIVSTGQLSELVKEAIPPKARNAGGHPAKRTFQALRIEVNRELDTIAPTLNCLIDALNPHGRLCVITFHSLEDRIVKQTFQQAAQGCTCPPDFPVCVCGKKPKIDILTRKPVIPSKEELEVNNRAHSAKLRIIEKRDTN